MNGDVSGEQGSSQLFSWDQRPQCGRKAPNLIGIFWFLVLLFNFLYNLEQVTKSVESYCSCMYREGVINTSRFQPWLHIRVMWELLNIPRLIECDSLGVGSRQRYCLKLPGD